MVDADHDGMVRRKQCQLFHEAKTYPEQRFTALFGQLLWEPWLQVALLQVLSNTGAKTPGVDGVTKADLRDAADQTALVNELRAQLEDGTYRPQPVRRVYIPKANGKQRPLGIPTIRDRVVQAAVKNLLEPIYEACFEDCSYGFRPNRCTWDALAEISQYLKRSSDYEWVIEGDIRDCFGSIDHDILMKQLRRRINDRRLLRLIWLMLRAGVLEDMRYYSTETGTPQGGIVSPLLANIYMHQLDEWAAAHSHRLTPGQRWYRRKKGKATIRLTRYADDFVICVKGTRDQAEALRAEVAELLKLQLRMDLSLEKTSITNRTEGFVFLGVHVRYRPSRSQQDAHGQRRWNVYQEPSPQALGRFKDKVRDLTSTATPHRPDTEVIRAINRLSTGWSNYYRHGNSAKLFQSLDHWVWHRVFHWLQRRHNMPPVKAWKRFYVERAIPVNRHPTSQSRRLGAWDEAGRHLAIWHLGWTKIKYWTYRGSRIPQPFKGDEATRRAPELPDYEVEAWPEGEDPRHTAVYRNVRELVRERDGYRCQGCGTLTRRGSEVHHKDGNAANHEPENVELLCKKCHTETKNYGRRKR